VTAVLYHRVSTLDQDQGLARADLEVAAKQRGFPETVHIEETGSGARNDRPGLARLMALAKAGKVAAVFVWKLDRFGRSALDVLANVRALKDAGVRFVATTQGIDVAPTGDAVSSLILTVLAAVAEFERDLIRERTRLAIDKARKLGRRIGRAPLPGETVAAMRERWQHGEGAYLIAKSLGLKESSVRNYCRRWEQEK
jgi:putative DNA-invertase from lambdoid prophage Rac